MSLLFANNIQRSITKQLLKEDVLRQISIEVHRKKSITKLDVANYLIVIINEFILVLYPF